MRLVESCHLDAPREVDILDLPTPQRLMRTAAVAMRRLVDEVLTDYDERALTSSLPPLSDPRSAARAVYDAVAGFGPLQRHLDDPEIEEIWIKERLTQG